MGLLHIYCGDGKGKTTAGWGLALRAAGAGMRVYVFQFLKGRETSELHAVAKIPNITVVRCDRDYGFLRTMTAQDKKEVTACHNRMLQKAKELMETDGADLLIFDEWNVAYASGLLDVQLADALVLERSTSSELVLTGRNPAQKFVDAADYVSEIRAVKHPLQKGIAARKGIEF